MPAPCRQTIPILVASLLVLLASGPIGADEVADRFRGVDANGDGRLSSEELPYPRLFERLDVDGDGFVSFDEARAARGLLRDRALRRGAEAPATATPDVVRHLTCPAPRSRAWIRGC